MRAVPICLIVLLLAPQADAQDSFTSRRLEAGVTLSWATGSDLGSRSAVLTRGSTSDRTPFTLFTTDARLEPAPAFAVTAGYGVTSWLIAEAAGRLRRADVAVAISGDAEGAAGRTIVGERLDEYAIDASALIRLPLGARGRVWPYAIAGGGYRRDAHAGRSSVDTGTSIHGGGGVKWMLSTRRRGALRGLGARAEIRVVQRRGGFRLDRASDVFASAGGGVFFVF